MAYYLDLFSPETYEAYGNSDRTVSGFRVRQRHAANRIRPGDILVCYLTKLSRWIGLLEVSAGPYEDNSPLFYPEDDPFVVRFRVKPVVWLPVEKALPIHENQIWEGLSFTREHQKTSSAWTATVRGSLVQLDDQDGALLESLIRAQETDGQTFPMDEKERRKFATHRVRRTDKEVSVTVPYDSEDDDDAADADQHEVRESVQIQALLAKIGASMGMHIWIPANDRAAVQRVWTGEDSFLLKRLPLNYDDTTLRTIEQIDVLWLKNRSIKRAFEIEHTTSIYSGILRMADLLALQPNMDIRLHIVAPEARKEKVFAEIKRPVFSLLEKGALSESCTYISYDNVKALVNQQHLAHLSDTVLDDYDEAVE